MNVIRNILDIKSIVVGLEVKDKAELLVTMVELAAESGKIQNPETATEKIFAREKLMSTGVGNGVALPHAKTNEIYETVASFAVLKKAIDYDSLDDEPVNVVLLVLGKEDNIGEHLMMLSNISKLLNRDSFISELLSAETSDEVLEIFDRYDD